MFILRKQLRAFYLTLVGLLVIILSTCSFFQKMMTLSLYENRKYVLQAAKNTTMGCIYDSTGTLLGSGTSVGHETWNTDYSECMGNLLGPSPELSKINAYYSRSYYADILFGQKQEHLSLSDLINISSERIGGNVQLTIDANLQKYAYDVLSAEFPKSAAVVLNYLTGDIMAAASVPSFDMNDEASLHITEETITDDKGQTRHNSYLDDERSVSKALHELYMPGSEIKGLLYTAALTYDSSLFDTPYTCTGSHTNQYDIEIKCAGETAHGFLSDMASALAESCNGYAEMVFEKLNATEEGRNTLMRTMQAFGFDTSISYPGLVYSDGVFLGPDPNPGDYESADAYEEALLEKQSMETYSAIGGGQCRTTVFGLAAAYAAIANHGLLVEPHLIKASSLYRDEPLTPYIGEDPKEVCGFDVAEKILDMMEGVTSDGTGKTMALENYRVFSKTGTAVHNDKSLETLWATAIIDSPDCPYVVVVMLDDTDANTQTSSGDAGRIVHKILQYLT